MCASIWVRRVIPRQDAVAGYVGSEHTLGFKDSYIPQLKAQGPLRICNESEEEKKRVHRGVASASEGLLTPSGLSCIAVNVGAITEPGLIERLILNDLHESFE